MKEKLKTLSDAQLIQVATELRQTSLPADALIRTLIEPNQQYVLEIINITACMTQELADRLASKL